MHKLRSQDPPASVRHPLFGDRLVLSAGWAAVWGGGDADLQSIVTEVESSADGEVEGRLAEALEGFVVRIELGIADFQYFAQDLRLTAPPGHRVEGVVLRKLPIGPLVDQAGWSSLRQVVNGSEQRFRGPDRLAWRDTGPTPAALEDLALMYAAQRAVGWSARKGVMAWFGMSRSTARDWIRRCKDDGLIPAEWEEAT